MHFYIYLHNNQPKQIKQHLEEEQKNKPILNFAYFLFFILIIFYYYEKLI
jgi:hypothetical protein